MCCGLLIFNFFDIIKTLPQRFIVRSCKKTFHQTNLLIERSKPPEILRKGTKNVIEAKAISMAE
jgi:hypothetical protein